ncbi:MAG: Hsp20/alpha crystallin family protein [Gammaproteobacteria bacterium]|nr:Hsp20/alpha crystallin family protein [Gammaproteobacteria bacterium]
MSLIRWSPFGDLDSYFDRVNNLNDLFDVKEREWKPAAAISETKKEYLVKADLPDVRKEDIHIALENGVLTVTGERKIEKESEDEKVHRMESFYGTFARSFSLPDNIDEGKIKAECKNGVLRIRIPKSTAEKKQAHKIEIN